MPLRSAEFIYGTSPGTWTCPDGVTAVWYTAVGGGGATCGHFSQGGGSGELCLNMMVPVVAGQVYTVIIGNPGIKSIYGVRPTGQSKSAFNGFNALEAGPSTTGGGAGQSGVGGGVGGHYDSDGGDVPKGLLESRHYVGGNGGTISGSYYVNPFFPGVRPKTCSLGYQPGPGLNWAFGYNTGGGGGGQIWGGTEGANDYVNYAPPDPGNKDADLSHYGAGGGGPGNTPSSTNGGNGAPGYVLLMWTEP